MSTILYGSHGHIGSVFASELDARGVKYAAGQRDYIHSQLLQFVKPTIVINCAAFVPQPNVTECDKFPEETILGNTVLPARLMDACMSLGFVFVQISTGCLWNDGREHSEGDAPQRGFGGRCGMYVGTKLITERLVSTMPKHYIFRGRLPFDNVDHPKNYLTKLANYDEIWDECNSLSHRSDFVKACLDLLDKCAPFGTYNVVNEGSLTASAVARRLQEAGIRKKPIAVTPGLGGQCRLKIDKLKSAGVSMRSAEEALEDSIRNWRPNVEAPH